MSLDLYNNQIGEQGAQHIADSLKTNQVNIFFLKILQNRNSFSIL